MKKIILLSFLFLFIFSQKINATPLDYIKPKTPTEKSVHSKKKKKKFFARMTERIMKRRAKKMIRKFDFDPTKCVRITKTDGKVIDALILRMGSDRIRYKKCDFVNGPSRTIHKEEIFKIEYADGKVELVAEQMALKKQERDAIEEAKIANGEYRQYWRTGFLLGFLLGLFGLILAGIIYDGEKRKRAVKGALAGILTMFLIILSLVLIILNSL